MSARHGEPGALRDYRRRVQIIFQDPYETLNPKQTIRDFVAEPLVVNSIGSSNEREAKVVAALESAGLRPAGDFMYRYPHELSGGQRQRVVIAGALVMDPEVIVADEPVSMLDVSIRTELLRLMLDLRRERGLTYLFITHDLSLAWVIADRIAVMYLGKIMEIGPAEAVIRSPGNPYTKALVSVSPSPDPPDAGTRARRTILVGETPDAAHIPTGCRFHPRCPVAFDRCKVEEPPLFDLGGGQAAACWLVEPGREAAAATASAAAAAVNASTAPAAIRRGSAGTQRPNRPREPDDAARASPRPGPDARRRLLAASAATVVAELWPSGRGRLASGAGRMERQRVRRAPHRSRAARVRRPDPADRRGRRARPAGAARGLGSAGRRRRAARSPACRRRAGAEFEALRTEGVELVRGLRPADLELAGMHPEVGLLRVDELLGEWVHHDRNHIRQMLAVTQARVWPQMGNARRFSLEDL